MIFTGYPLDLAHDDKSINCRAFIDASALYYIATKGCIDSRAMDLVMANEEGEMKLFVSGSMLDDLADMVAHRRLHGSISREEAFDIFGSISSLRLWPLPNPDRPTVLTFALLNCVTFSRAQSMILAETNNLPLICDDSDLEKLGSRKVPILAVSAGQVSTAL